ncbi:putative ferric-chelate reductase 1 [Xiphophorus hellerii]|uniref:putative ferric-chelate reductase 1 n=1 Tax=Xiphophorus hellerii TaxID=8084 RepID=UPI0013B3F07C|nr:putative ferric-chelate reductase 1 [Xiphophorus hellerii]XP_032440241.1 putative ferric-chelate reductase 1 [Xiphophorus hellerii]
MDKRLILSVLLVVLSWEFMPTYAETNDMVTFNSTATDNRTETANTTVTSTKNATTVAPTNINITAESGIIHAIMTSISRQECGTSKLCVDTPSKCDPASGDCYFLSVKKQSNQKYTFELSGQAQGYISAGLSTDAYLNDSGIAYICANHNGGVRFFAGFFNNLVPNVTDLLNVTEKHGSVNSSKIQCIFTADLPDTEKRAAGYAIGIFTGPYNSSTGELGVSKSKTQTTAVVDLSDPTANLIGNSASFVYPVTHTHSFLPVLLATMCLLAFTAG